MKKFLVVPVIALLAIPAFATSTKTSTTKSYDSAIIIPVETHEPVMGSDMQSEEERHFEQQNLGTDTVEQEKMEERMEDNSRYSTISEGEVDYWDRTRTNRARKALNTGGDASDDQ
jgi:hypothetical protein